MNIARDIVRKTAPMPIRKLYWRFLAVRSERREAFRLTRFYKQFMGSGDLVFDVGANHGGRTKAFRLLGARVVAFEPNPACVSVLRSKFSTDRFTTIVPKAVGPGVTGSLKLSATHHEVSTLLDEFTTTYANWNYRDSLSVEMIGLDAAIAEYGKPRFIKIDVEGYELAALSTLSQSVEAVAFEVHRELVAIAIKCAERLDGLGMKRFQISTGETLMFTLPGWTDLSGIIAALDGMAPGHYCDVYARS